MGIPHAAISSVIVNVVLPFAAAVVVGLRFYVRIRTKQPLMGDDWTILGSLVREVSMHRRRVHHTC